MDMQKYLELYGWKRVQVTEDDSICDYWRDPTADVLCPEEKAIKVQQMREQFAATLTPRKPRVDKYNPRDVAALGGDPSL